MSASLRFEIDTPDEMKPVLTDVTKRRLSVKKTTQRFRRFETLPLSSLVFKQPQHPLVSILLYYYKCIVMFIKTTIQIIVNFLVVF